MARTHRVKKVNPYRHTKHFAERAELTQLILDNYIEGYNICGTNRIHKRLNQIPRFKGDRRVGASFDKYA